MVRELSEWEYAIVRRLKNAGALLNLEERSVKERVVFTKTAGGIMCSDKDTDMQEDAEHIFAAFLHTIQVFGGPFDFIPEYAEYEPAVAAYLWRNLERGMRHKGTKDLFVFFHAPCGMADLFSHSIQQIVTWASRFSQYMPDTEFYREVNMKTLFHVRRINAAGSLEQSTYLVEPEKLLSCISRGLVAA